MGGLIIFLLRSLGLRRLAANRQFSNIIYQITRYKPNNISLYKLALQPSTAKGVIHSNERLEFVGDAALSLIVAEYLYKKYPLQAEGFLTELRARIVNRKSLNSIARKLGIDNLLNRSEIFINKRSLDTIYGNSLEALIGAVCLDQGYCRCREFVVDSILHIHVDLDLLARTDTNYKSQIMNWAQKNQKDVQFELVEENYRNNHREFVVQLHIGKLVSSIGYGRNKKEAEQMAAQEALKDL